MAITYPAWACNPRVPPLCFESSMPQMTGDSHGIDASFTKNQQIDFGQASIAILSQSVANVN